MKLEVIGDFHTIPVNELLASLHSTTKGLTELEAKQRSEVYGLNELSRKEKLHPFLKFLSYFKSPLIIILIVAAAISGLTGEFKSAVIIIAMVFLSVVLNFYQEHKSSKAAEQIAKKLSVRATVLRDGNKKEVLTKYLVPGDIVFLSAGDIVPADGRVVQTDDFFVNESVLTGESFPVEKGIGIKDNADVVFSGTNVVSGYAQFVVVATGVSTEYGQIADKLAAPEQANAFEVGIKNFGYLIIKVIVVIVLLILLINTLYHKDFIASLVFSIAVAVGVTPELLPMIMSVNMARGSIKMAKKGVIVKRLNAIPDFGSMDVLCTDKTGTLTEDKISLVKYIDVFGKERPDVLRIAYVNGFFETGLKSVLDKAILDYKNISTSGLKKIDEIPYDFMRRRSSIVYEEKESRHMATKGAPEEIFKICTTYFDGSKNNKITPQHLKNFTGLYDDLSSQGYRVLAIAKKEVSKDRRVYPKSMESAMTLEGFIAFLDPPKASAKDTLVFMKKHGIDIKILTGDSPLVTKKVCEELNLPITGIITGEELDTNVLGSEAMAAKVRENNIFARLSPSQKERVISTLRKQGLVVGYLGDGINDAPSLRSADVGISVENAVDVAKETADIILMKKGLKELMDGVLEGRKTFGNTMKYLMMGLSSNFGNMFSMIGAALYLPFFPMLPGQILVNNFLYDASQLSIPSDNVDQEYLLKPKHWDIKFIRNFMYIFGPISSLFDILTFIILFSVFHLGDSLFQAGWFIESLATQTFVVYVIRTRQLPFIKSRPSKFLLFTTVGAVVVGVILTTPLFGKFFGFSWLPFHVLATIFGLVFVYLLLVESVKRVFYRKLDERSRALAQGVSQK
jgi:P-type Mg2+ transporter